MTESAFPLNFEQGGDDQTEPSAAVKPQRKSTPTADVVGRIMRVDPALCDISPLNGRDAAKFDPIANKDLIESIRDRGQQIPAIVRPGASPGRYELIAGTRRLGAVRILRATSPEAMLLVEVRQLADPDAWSVAVTENSDRKDITDLERAQNWRFALATVFDGNQNDLARSLGVDKSVVSRMISLATLPEEITSLVLRPDMLRVNFAEKLAPVLKDDKRRQEILGLAGNLGRSGVKLAPAELVRRLTLPPAEAEAFRPVPIKAGSDERQARWQRKPDGSSQINVRAVPPELSKEDRKALLKELTDCLRAHILGT